MSAGGRPAWPGGAPYALCLTHDVDRVRKYIYHYLWHGLRGGGSAVRRQTAMLADRLKGQRHYWNFERIMALETGYGVRSTFLFLNEKAKGLSPKFWGRYDINAPELRTVMQELGGGGWEVGLHGSYYSFDDPELLRHEKLTLEDILGQAVRSTRQHFLNLAAPRTWLIQRSIGLDVDSTVGYARQPWDDWSRVMPYYEPASGILELPITLMDTIGLGRPENRFACHATLEQVKSRGGLIVLDWHQRTFTPNDWPDAVAFYRETIERSLADSAWVATMAEVADHWRGVVPTAG